VWLCLSANEYQIQNIFRRLEQTSTTQQAFLEKLKTLSIPDRRLSQIEERLKTLSIPDRRLSQIEKRL
jgi:hypothetical protein